MKNRKLLLILQAAIFVFLAALVLSNFYIMIMQVVFKKEMPKVFGFAQAVVVSGSMQPVIEVGDLLILREQKEYKIDDIVTFKGTNSFVTHRIVKIEGDRAVTKGDSNNVADEPIQLSRIEGKVIWCISGAGTLIFFLKTPFGILLLIIAAILIVEMPYLFAKYRRIKKS